jgi:hypothetical protein
VGGHTHHGASVLYFVPPRGEIEALHLMPIWQREVSMGPTGKLEPGVVIRAVTTSQTTAQGTNVGTKAHSEEQPCLDEGSG